MCGVIAIIVGSWEACLHIDAGKSIANKHQKWTPWHLITLDTSCMLHVCRKNRATDGPYQQRGYLHLGAKIRIYDIYSVAYARLHIKIF